MLITMRCIVTDPELQPSKLVAHWKYDPHSDSFYIGRGLVWIFGQVESGNCCKKLHFEGLPNAKFPPLSKQHVVCLRDLFYETYQAPGM
jgi:hypothetical protein